MRIFLVCDSGTEMLQRFLVKKKSYFTGEEALELSLEYSSSLVSVRETFQDLCWMWKLQIVPNSNQLLKLCRKFGSSFFISRHRLSCDLYFSAQNNF